ncbi:MAG TPA: hypothetical protein VG410_07770 [Solirubrobacteraceae bacterium]|nr:hypothetical protein [Solirubrobacteraceae bacterium]
MSLEDELPGALPDGLRGLTEDQREDLAGAIRDARRRQASALAEAGEQAFAQIPRLLRGPIRRMFS